MFQGRVERQRRTHDEREQDSRASVRKTWHPSVQRLLIAYNDLPRAISHANQVHLSLHPRKTLVHKETLPD